MLDGRHEYIISAVAGRLGMDLINEIEECVLEKVCMGTVLSLMNTWCSWNC